MSDRDVLALIDRAASESPQMSVVPDQVVAGGRRRVRRRRAAGAGMTLGGLALAGALWVSLGQGLVGADQEVVPATVLDTHLVITPDPSTGELTATRDGQVLEALPAEPLTDGLTGWRDTDGTLVVVGEGKVDPGTGDYVPVVRAGEGGLHAGPELVLDHGVVEVGRKELPALRLQDGGDTLVAVLVTDPVDGVGEDAFLGTAPQGSFSEDRGDGGVAWLDDPEVPLWAWVVPGDDRVPVGGTGSTLMARQVKGDTATAFYELRALLPESPTGGDLGRANLIADPEVNVNNSGGAIYADGTGPELWTATVSAPADADLADLVEGLDIDRDGDADLLLAKASVVVE